MVSALFHDDLAPRQTLKKAASRQTETNFYPSVPLALCRNQSSRLPASQRASPFSGEEGGHGGQGVYYRSNKSHSHTIQILWVLRRLFSNIEERGKTGCKLYIYRLFLCRTNASE